MIRGTEILAFCFLLSVFFLERIGDFAAPPVSEETVITDVEEAEIAYGNRFTQFVSIALFLFAAFQPGSTLAIRRYLRSNRFVGGYLLFLGASLFYSFEPSLTIRRLALYWIMIVFGIFSSRGESGTEPLHRILKILYVFGVVYLFIGVGALGRNILSGQRFFVDRFSLYGSSHRDAEVFGLTILIGWYLLTHGLVQRTWWNSTLVFCIAPFLTLATLSRTSLLALACSVVYLLVFTGKGAFVKTWRTAILASAGFSILYFFPHLLPPGVVRADTVETLTGRTDLWALLIQPQFINPIFGTGFGAFWNVETITLMEKAFGWAAPAAHNGFLDVLLNTGLVGEIFLLGLLVIFWKRAAILESSLCSSVRAILIFVLVQNMAQGSFQSTRIYVEVVFWWVLISLPRKLQPSPGSF